MTRPRKDLNCKVTVPNGVPYTITKFGLFFGQRISQMQSVINKDSVNKWTLNNAMLSGVGEIAAFVEQKRWQLTQLTNRTYSCSSSSSSSAWTKHVVNRCNPALLFPGTNGKRSSPIRTSSPVSDSGRRREALVVGAVRMRGHVILSVCVR